MAETKVKKENMEFQTEVNQLLHLMIHSLYSNKEIFVRELVSNASDACDKLRFEAISDDSLYEGDSELRIEVEFDEEANSVTIRDNGIGMTREDVINNIGTIAKSGTKEFLSKLSGDAAKDSNLIGQFGVGFYSSFIVADKVTLTTRRAGDKPEQAVVWESNGENGFTLEDTTKEAHGTEIVLHLKEDEKEFANDYRLRSIISTYSDHIPLPVKMRKRDEEGKLTEEWEVVNKANALWTEPKSNLKDEDYQEFYKHIAHDWENPLAWSHNSVEGKLEYKSLLYIPSKAPFDLWEPEQKNGIKLYVQRVFIMDDTKNLMPHYLRFVRGVIDSNDLPLNVSREILQSNHVVESMRKASVKKVLGLLEKMAKNDKENYQKFWNEFGRALKEGPGEDMANKEQIAKLLRFSSTHTDSEEQTVTLEDYVSRMKEEQEEIYYITAETFASAKNSPHLEVFRKKEIEVLLLSDRVDEWLVNGLQEFDGKKLQSVAKGELDLSKFDTEEDKKEQEEVDKKADGIIKHLKEVLGEKVEDVRVSHRLTSSPSCIVLNEQDMALYMQTLMKQAGHDMPSNKPVLEINPTHPLIERMETETDDEQFGDWAEILFDQALLAEGAQLEDPAGFVSKLNKLMLKMS
ncbi:molecular chaperone HtpG [Cocleimonas sp. KMM 6892]|uniref:molecular chaperone HtpG n=1 Tax=unclassified Cocleimonas TaxID=2639732 RepID=UPI002DB8D553|nr:MULTISPECIES: molecular chaperone HtpG [unclassified Cocleimonas]MEB8433627.1 molecular chaperone HtpG [Cocleimonas sp. KMM 6892]MEC4716438.1 molecular chaperone HtpG [Cocleimonas sp. KMM 6895]MEC4745669.1 molecular chaperone HtpG [Cocleimonas sp. KMM 6896]